jgi:hypothetical protein
MEFWQTLSEFNLLLIVNILYSEFLHCSSIPKTEWDPFRHVSRVLQHTGGIMDTAMTVPFHLFFTALGIGNKEEERICRQRACGVRCKYSRHLRSSNRKNTFSFSVTDSART